MICFCVCISSNVIVLGKIVASNFEGSPDWLVLFLDIFQTGVHQLINKSIYLREYWNNVKLFKYWDVTLAGQIGFLNVFTLMNGIRNRYTKEH